MIFPNPNVLRDQLSRLPATNESVIGWSALINFNKTNNAANPDWYPFVNEFDFLSFALMNNPKLGVTHQIMNFVIKIMKTLKNNGVIDEEYKIPANALAIVRRWDTIPQPPVC